MSMILIHGVLCSIQVLSHVTDLGEIVHGCISKIIIL